MIDKSLEVKGKLNPSQEEVIRERIIFEEKQIAQCNLQIANAEMVISNFMSKKNVLLHRRTTKIKIPIL